VVGMSTAAGGDALKDESLTISVEKKYSDEAKGTVLKQTPRSRLEVPEGTTVQIIVAPPFPRISSVRGSGVRATG
jgi:beta-lactam-binding protein with PASTA domain